ncbi:MAG: peptidoglycan D,D-transpeptidase FtsI family protein [Microthrixaceae bacterium]
MRAPHLSVAGAGRRLRILGILLGLLAFGAVAKLATVQLRDASTLSAKGVADRQRHETIPAMRGAILDRTGVDLAVSVPQVDVAISRKALASVGIESDEALIPLADSLATDLGVPARSVRSALLRAEADDDNVPIATAIAPERADAARETLTESNLQGVLGVEQTSARVHPAGESALRVIGTLDRDGRPNDWAGIEKQYDTQLTGSDGRRVAERTRDGRTIMGSERVEQPARPGQDVQLTLDRALQFDAEQILTRGAAAAGAAGGIAVIGRPSTGELLAVASVERDPSTGEMGLASGPLAFSNSYQAGSVFKLVTTAAAYESGAIDDSSTFTVPSSITVADRTFDDHHQHATETMTVDEIIADSSNVGTIQIGRRVGAERLHRTLSDFGFGQPTGVGHPAEGAGVLPDASSWTEPDLAAASIGTFQSSTVLQLWAAYNVIANRGMYVPPRLVSSTIDASGVATPVAGPAARRVVSEESAARVDRALRKVVADGTAKHLDLPGYLTAAKTGTGRMPSPKRVDSTDDYVWADGTYHYVATFAGYLPADRPQVSITVLLFDTPPGSTGGGTSGPVFAELARSSIRELGIAPSSGDAASAASAGPARIRSAPATAPNAASSSTSSSTSSTTSSSTSSTTTTTVPSRSGTSRQANGSTTSSARSATMKRSSG